MATTINGVIINKISKEVFDQKVASDEITQEMIAQQLWVFTDDQFLSEEEKAKLGGIEAGAQVNPTKLSELSNDVGFVTSTVNNLSNYYLKTEAYSKTEVNSMIGNITTMAVQVVNSLPATGQEKTIYLVPKAESENQNAKDEYLWVNGAFEKIGDTTIDLTNYAKKSEIPTKTSQLTNDSGFLTQHQDLSAYAKKTELPTKTSDLQNDSGFLTQHQDLSAYALKSEIPSVPTCETRIW